MKIAQLVCVYPPYAGGIGTSAANLSGYFGWDTVTLKPRGIATKEDNKITYLNPLIRFGHAALPFSLNKILKPYDLIYFHYPFFGAGLALCVYKLFHPKTKIVIQYHMDTGDLQGFKKILAIPERLISRLLFNQASKIIVSSLDYIEHSEIKNYYLKNKTKFIAVPFAIDTNKFSPQDNLNRTDTKEIIFVGGLDKAHYFKGVDNLIQALAAVNFSNWRLSIVGSGELEEKYRQLAKDLNLADRINFLSKLDREELIPTYCRHDVLVLPSINRHEAFGIVLIEAMACGLAVIASELPGVRSVFSAAEGLKTKPNDIADLTAKLNDIFAKPERLGEMKKAARNLARQKYDLEQIKEKLNRIIQEA